MQSGNIVIVSITFAITLFFQLFSELFLVAVLKNLSKSYAGTNAFLFLTCKDRFQHLSDFSHDCIETFLPNLCKLLVDSLDIRFLEEFAFVEHPLEADKMQGKVVMIFVVLSLVLVIKYLSLRMRTSFGKADHAAVILHFITDSTVA